MQRCWSLDPSERPSFSHLVQLLSQALEGLSDYMDIGRFKAEPDAAASTSFTSTIVRSDHEVQETGML